MANLKVWCLFIDSERKASFGRAFPVEVLADANVDDLCRKVEEAQSDVLENIVLRMLTVWRCTDPKLLANMNKAQLQKALMNADLTNEAKAEELGGGRMITTLSLSEDEILLVQLPAMDESSRPTTPQNKTSLSPQGTPLKSIPETRKRVDEFFRRHDKKIKEYLAGPVWKNFWEAAPPADPRTVAFISDLEIPKINDDPVLLLHNLGNGIVDEKALEDIFTKGSVTLVNTSGSGKTRLLFEGLCKHWGFYLTTIVEGSNHKLGSLDMMEMIYKYIPESKRFKRTPQDMKDCDINHAIAERRMQQILTARLLVFERFLGMAMAQGSVSNQSVNEFRKHWLFLQLCSIDILDVDVFEQLTQILADAEKEYLLTGTAVNGKLVELQENYGLDQTFFIVLDEAQLAVNNLKECFRSYRDDSIKRPVLRPILNVLTKATKFPIILSGTGLSLDDVNTVMGSVVVKLEESPVVTSTGAFDDPKSQRDYIERYMPGHILESDTGKELLSRAWSFARGRHRFTASLLTELLRFQYLSPHKVFNACIKKICGFYPTDGGPFADEVDIEEAKIKTKTLDFSQLLHHKRRQTLSEVLYKWLIEQIYCPILGEDRRLVELGFARFVCKADDPVLVDEPLVLLAAMRHFREEGDFTLEKYIARRFGDDDSVGTCLEHYVAFALVCAIDRKCRLCDILDFGEVAPEWAEQCGELVSIDWNGEEAEVNAFHLAGSRGGKTSLGSNRRSKEDTVKWFERPTSLFCLPDNQMGPDIVLYVRLASGLIIALVVQVKWRSQNSLPSRVLQKAMLSLNHENFYHLKESSHEDTVDAREFILKKVEDLKKLGPTIQTDRWLTKGYHMLRVIASYPAIINSKPQAPYTFLNMDNVLEYTRHGDAIRNYALKRVRGDADDGAPPKKKQR